MPAPGGAATLKEPSVRADKREIAQICAAQAAVAAGTDALFAANRTRDTLRTLFILPILRRQRCGAFEA